MLFAASCGGDPNAVAGCGGNCGRLCSNYKDGNVSCTAECQRNACDCKKGFVYDDEGDQKCVHPKQCKSKLFESRLFEVLFVVKHGGPKEYEHFQW